MSTKVLVTIISTVGAVIIAAISSGVLLWNRSPTHASEAPADSAPSRSSVKAAMVTGMVLSAGGDLHYGNDSSVAQKYAELMVAHRSLQEQHLHAKAAVASLEQELAREKSLHESDLEGKSGFSMGDAYAIEGIDLVAIAGFDQKTRTAQELQGDSFSIAYEARHLTVNGDRQYVNSFLATTSHRRVTYHVQFFNEPGEPSIQPYGGLFLVSYDGKYYLCAPRQVLALRQRVSREQ